MEKALIDYKERILQMARISPLLPNDVAKSLRINTIMASAMLSELSSKGLLKVSSIKVGSSPLYYLPNDGHKLQNYESYLNEKDRKTVGILREKRILQDSELDSFTRVSLRQTKDFAVPLEVTFNNQKDIFWKWYLLQDSEAEQLIKELLQPKEQKLSAEEAKGDGVKKEQAALKDWQTPIHKEFKKKTSARKKSAVKEISDSTLEEFFDKNNVKIIEKISIKKNSRSFIIQISSALGPLDYYGEAVFKKRISEKDLNNAFVNGQIRKLPVIFFSSGELTAQALEILKELKGITFKQIHGS